MIEYLDYIGIAFFFLFVGYSINILRRITIKIYKNAQEAHDRDVPKYVRMSNNPKKDRGTEMRLRYSDDILSDGQVLEYWRDAGLWGINFRWEQRGLFKRVLVTDASIYDNEMAKRLDGVLLTPISKEQYEKGNDGYLPTNYEEELIPVDLDAYGIKDDELAF